MHWNWNRGSFHVYRRAFWTYRLYNLSKLHCSQYSSITNLPPSLQFFQVEFLSFIFSTFSVFRFHFCETTVERAKQHNEKHVHWFFSLPCVYLCLWSGALVGETPSTGSLFKIHIYLIACNLFKLRFNYPLIYIRTYIHACWMFDGLYLYVAKSYKLQTDDKAHLNRKLLTFAKILFAEKENNPTIKFCEWRKKLLFNQNNWMLNKACYKMK